MAQTREEKQQVIRDIRRHAEDTGSPEVQAAILTKDIVDLTEHCQEHPKDNSSRLGLVKKVSKRRRLMSYLKGENVGRYQSLLQQLNLKK
jgi:small subunit ribosomal protein S15